MVVCISLLLLKSVNAQAVDSNDQQTSIPQSTSEIPAGSIEIEGNRLTVQQDRALTVTGKALIRKDNRQIYGDMINYDIQNDELHVLGDARLDLGDTHIQGPEIKLRLTENLGEMTNASITMNKTIAGQSIKNQYQNLFDTYSQPVLANSVLNQLQDPKTFLSNNPIENTDIKIGMGVLPISLAPSNSAPLASRGDAETVFFEGQDKKRLKNARYTTCPAGVDDWYIKSTEMTINDYSQTAEAKHAYIEFKGIPILYSPWVRFSYSGERKSGLLTPSIGTTTLSGFELAIPYYWNISPNKDATLTARYLTKRGLQLQGEFRYLEPTYSGIDRLEYLNQDYITDQNRYYINLAHTQNFGSGWSGGFNYQKVSDNQYFSELSTHITTTSLVNLPQAANINYTGSVWQFNGLAEKYQNLDGVSYPYQRLPQLTLTANKNWGDFTTKLDSQFTYFSRDTLAPLTVTGARTAIYPSISMPMLRPYGFLTPKIGLNMVGYALNNNIVTANGNTFVNNSATRTLPVVSLDGGLYFDRSTSFSNTPFTQTLEPRLYYLYTPYSNQSALPVFDTSLADLNINSLFYENQFTGYDRINNANQISVGLTSRFIDATSGVERLSGSIGQRFYFTDQKVALPGYALSTRGSSDIVAAATARLSNQWRLDASTQYDPAVNGITRSNISASYNPAPGKLLNLAYHYTSATLNPGAPVNQFDISGQWPLGNRTYGIGRWNYSMLDKRTIEGLAGLEYDAGCWQARVVVQRLYTATAQANTAIFFQLELGGLASIGKNPLAVLRREIPGFRSSSELSNEIRQQNY